jgi:hypothetical protein
MSPLSQRPEARARQLANLQKGGPAAPGGNRRAERHGGYSQIAKRDLDEKVAEVYAAIGEDLPLREDGQVPRADAVALRLLAECLCRIESVSDFLGRRGWQDKDGEVRPAVDLERRLRAEALDLLRELGLTPAARAKLGVELVRMAGAAEEAAEAQAAREKLDGRFADLDADTTEEVDSE